MCKVMWLILSRKEIIQLQSEHTFLYSLPTSEGTFRHKDNGINMIIIVFTNNILFLLFIFCIADKYLVWFNPAILLYLFQAKQWLDIHCRNWLSDFVLNDLS